MGAASAERSGDGSVHDRRFLSISALVGIVAFAIACVIVDRLARADFYGPLHDALWVAPYSDPAAAILGGAFPYRDVPIEYPPLGLAVFLLPALVVGTHDYDAYRAVFEALIALCGMAIVPLVVATVARLGGSRMAVVAAAGLVAATPLLLGPTAISRYDLWPALLTAGAVWAVIARHRRLAFGLVALGTVAKVYPAVLVPILLVEAWRAKGWREASIGLGIAVVIVGLVMAPFLAASPGGALDSLTRSFERPLQIESLGATVLILVHDVAGLPLAPVSSEFGSHNLVGTLPSAVATAQSIAMIASIVVVWLLTARGPASPRRVALACAAAIVAEVALGKVFSDQYALWLVPAVAVLAPARGLRPILLVAAVLAVTGFCYPGRYVEFVRSFDLVTTVLYLGRNVAVLVLATYLGLALASRRVHAHGRAVT